MEGRKFDGEKPDPTLLHYGAFDGVLRVLAFGAKKYARDNWKKVQPKERYLRAMLRHAHALSDGQTHDPESKLHHIDHIICNAMFYAYFVQQEELACQPTSSPSTPEPPAPSPSDG